jgi:DNA-binding LacI/PurR family transcriptional regulator
VDIERIKRYVEEPTPAPLHQRLREAIQEQITDTTLQPGSALPSERSLKDTLGISRSTVRQAINALIQDGYLQSVAGTGNFVLEPPTNITETRLVGLVTSSPNFNFFYPQLAAAFNQRMRGAGYGLVMSLHDEQAEQLSRTVDDLLRQNVAALAITPPRYGEIDTILAALRRRKIPVVLIGRSIKAPHVDLVATDNRDIGYRATRHLLELGHKHIAYMGLLGYSTGERRVQGYRQAMEEASLPPHIYQLQDRPENSQDADGFPREHLAEPAQAAVHQIWGQDGPGDLPQPTAIFCFNDIVAMGAYKALRELGYRIPADVSLVSVDNLLTIRHFEVPLSTFALPGEAIGSRSADLLLRRLEGDTSQSETALLRASFVPRASTAPPPA